ncbi:hypothetical protein [Streptomyces bottropensis]|jgi:hypothetical protein|uniref:hypothetical protein n=1 Tax=Streptomyces bottropensis TaxID=42235 RepID=UPI003681AB75
MVATSLALSFSFAVHAAGATYAADTTAEADKTSSQNTAAQEKVTEASDVQSARLAAVLGGTRVEAVSERTADSTTWVNPNGSLTTETASGDIRVREGGKWKRIDTTLVDAGSRLEPKTAVAEVALSDGGSGDFASVSRARSPSVWTGARLSRNPRWTVTPPYTRRSSRMVTCMSPLCRTGSPSR